MTKNVKVDKKHFKLLVNLKIMGYWAYSSETEVRSPSWLITFTIQATTEMLVLLDIIQF